MERSAVSPAPTTFHGENVFTDDHRCPAVDTARPSLYLLVTFKDLQGWSCIEVHLTPSLRKAVFNDSDMVRGVLPE